MLFAPDANQNQYDCVHEAELDQLKMKISDLVNYPKSCICFGMAIYATMPDAASAGRCDTLTGAALNALGYSTRSLNNSHAESINPGKHCNANWNNLHRLIVSMQVAWGYIPPVDALLIDYGRFPSGYLAEVFKNGFYSDVLTYFLDPTVQLLKPGGVIWIAITPHHAFKIHDLIDPKLYASIEVVEDLNENPLVMARELAREELLASRSNYCNETQLREISSFFKITKKAENPNNASNCAPSDNLCQELRALRQPFTSRPLPITEACALTTPHHSKRRRVSNSSSRQKSARILSSPSSSICTSRSSTSNPVIDLTGDSDEERSACDCDDEYTPEKMGIKKPRACSICIYKGRVKGRVGFTP